MNFVIELMKHTGDQDRFTFGVRIKAPNGRVEKSLCEGSGYSLSRAANECGTKLTEQEATNFSVQYGRFQDFYLCSRGDGIWTEEWRGLFTVPSEEELEIFAKDVSQYSGLVKTSIL